MKSIGQSKDSTKNTTETKFFAVSARGKTDRENGPGGSQETARNTTMMQSSNTGIHHANSLITDKDLDASLINSVEVPTGTKFDGENRSSFVQISDVLAGHSAAVAADPAGQNG